MSENRTEKPTRQKLKKARERGEVPKSSLLAGALVFTGAILLIWGLHHLFTERFQESMRAAFLQLKELKIEGAFYHVLSPLLPPVLTTLFGMVLIALAANLVQTGWIWAPGQIKPKWRRKGKERPLLFPLLQFAVIVAAGYLALRTKIDPALLFATPQEQSAYIFKKMMALAIEMGALFLFLGLCDFFYQKWRYYKRMHMTPQEKKQELRESEGDPQIKRRMRE